MKRILWFSQSKGLDNVNDPIERDFNPEKGIEYAKICYNIDFKRIGRFGRRKGWNYTDITSSCHSLFCDGGVCLFVTGDALCMLNEDFTYTALRNVSEGREMDYQQVGSRIYYTNGVENGYILNDTSYAWTLPSTVYNTKDSTKVLSPPPLGNMLAYFNGRMYVVQNYIAWHSKAYDLNVFNMTEGYMAFESAVTMFSPVTQGIWVGTNNKIAFISGSSPKDFKYEKKALYDVIPGTAVEVDGSKIGDSQLSGVGVMFASKEGGLFFGSADGRLVPLTARQLTFPAVAKGSAVCIEDRYIVSLGTQYDTTKLTATLQLERVAPSQYLNYNFNSYAKFNGKYFGANENGIFQLDYAQFDISSSSSKANIEAKYRSTMTDFGIKTDKRIRKCRIGLETNDQVKIGVTCNESQNVTVHELPAKRQNTQHYTEVPVGRDLKGRYFDFTVENLNGSDFSIDDIEAHVNILVRKPVKEGAN